MSGNSIGTIVGAAIGLLVPVIGPGLGASIGGAVGGMLLPDKLGIQDQNGPRLNDLSVTSASYGATIPKTYGAYRISGNVIWTEGIREVKHVREEEVGKGSETYDVTWFTYSVDIAIGICEGEIHNISKVWADSILIWDANTGGFTTSIVDQDEASGNMSIYTGRQDQKPDWLMQKSEPDTPAYRNVAYVVFNNLQLEVFKNRIPNFTFEVNSQAPPEALPMILGGHSTIEGFDITDPGIRNYDPILPVKASAVNGVINSVKFVGAYDLPVGDVTPRITQGWAEYHIFQDDQVRRQAPIADYEGMAADDQFNQIPSAGSKGWTQEDKLSSTLNFIGTVYDFGDWGGTSHQLIGLGIFANPYGGRQIRTLPSKIVERHGSLYAMADTMLVDGIAGTTNRINVQKIIKYSYPPVTVQTKKGSSSPPVSPEYECYVTYAGTEDTARGKFINPDHLPCSEIHLEDDFVPDLVYDFTRPIQDIFDVSEYTNIDKNNNGRYDFFVGIDNIYFIETYNMYDDGPLFITMDLDGNVTDQRILKHPMFSSNMRADLIVHRTDAIVYLVIDYLSRHDSYNVWSKAVFEINTFDDYRIDYLGYTYVPDRYDWYCFTFAGTPYLDIIDGRFYMSQLEMYSRSDSGWPNGQKWLGAGIWSLYSASYEGIPLSEIIIDLLVRGGIDESVIEAGEAASTTVKGFLVAKQMSTRSAIAELQKTYLFDLIEQDFGFVVRMRGDFLSVGTISHQDVSGVIEIATTIDTEIPRKVTLRYPNKNTDYQAGSQTAIRIDGNSDNNVVIETVVVFTDDEAKQLAEKLLYSSWGGKSTIKLSIPFTNKYSVADIVTIVDVTVTYNARIVKINYSDNHLMQVDLVVEDTSSYTSNAEGSSTDDGFLTNRPDDISNTYLEVFNAPHLINNLIKSRGIYYGAEGYGDLWRGCEVFKSKNSGQTYQSVGAILDASVIGQVSPALKYHKSAVWDTTSVLNVFVGDDVLYSVSQEEINNGTANLALVGKEVIQFKDVIEKEYGVYELTNLIRGLQGTENAAGEHEDFELFVMLNLDLGFSFSTLDLERKYVAASFGKLVDYNGAIDRTYDGTNLKPLSPTRLNSVLMPNGDKEITWNRRDRYVRYSFNTSPFSETSEIYKLEFLASGVIVREEEIYSDYTFLYTVSMQSTDGNVDLIRAYQFSDDIFKAGEYSEITI